MCLVLMGCTVSHSVSVSENKKESRFSWTEDGNIGERGYYII